MALAELLAEEYAQRALVGVALAALAGSSLSMVVRFTGSQFLAIEALHTLLAASAAGHLIYLFYPLLPPELYMYAAMLGFMLIVAVLERGRVEHSTAVAAMTFVAAVIASLASYGLALYSPTGPVVIYRALFGSPYFLLREEILPIVAWGLILLALIYLSWSRLKILAFDPEYFEFMKGSASLLAHKLFIYLLVAAGAVYITKIMGAVAAHVMLIAPAMAPLGKNSPPIVILYALAVSFASLLLSLQFNLPYGASFGIVAILAYLLPSLKGR